MSAIADISIRANLYLWLLTGRSSGFANAALNTSINYVVQSTPEEVTYARKFLKLDVLQNDFNVLAIYAASLMSKPMLRDMPYSEDAVFTPGLLALPKVVTSVPMLGFGDDSFGYVDGGIAGAKGFTRVGFTRLSDTAAKVETDNGLTATSSTRLIIMGSGDLRLRIDAAPGYGVFADFLVPQWTNDDTVVIELAPTRYPYVATVAKLRNDRVMVRLLNSEETLAAFESSPANPALQVGMAGLAIIRRMLRWISEEQSGYNVSLVSADDPAEPLATLHEVTPAFVPIVDVPADPAAPVGFDV